MSYSCYSEILILLSSAKCTQIRTIKSGYLLNNGLFMK